jgi:imidazolonepropionase-like amidohydrolase
VLRFLLCLLIPVFLFAARRERQRAPEARPSTLHDVAVVDVAAAQLLQHRDIIIPGEQIAEIRPATTHRRGERYVIPGLWDMHVHLWNEDPKLGSYLANGVTTVRDMGSDLKHVRLVEARIARGEMAGPRIYASGAAVSASPTPPDSRMPVKVIRTPNEARHIFDVYYDERVDVIRTLNLDARSFEALAERSRHDGIPFAGTLPDSVPAADAALDRMVSMERLSGIGLACSSRQSELRARLQTVTPAEAQGLDAEIMDTYDAAAANSLWDLFRRYGVRQTPMLTSWSRANSDQAYYDFALQLTREMARAGVAILAGTDTGEPGTVPGVELHRELELLETAGLSPAEALRAATLEPAKLMRRDDLGEVKKGATADLVVLTANPLADVRNTRAIDEVIVRGKIFAGHAGQ